MADEPKNQLPEGSSANQPAEGLPLRPLNRQELLRQEAELAAQMQAKLDRACQPEPPATPAGNKLGARKDASFKAICTAPSINWTPAGSGQVPVPYQTVQDLSNSTATARTVRFNGLPVYLLDQTTQPKGTGDERGTKKGIRSGTVTGEVKPLSGCRTVRIEGKQVVREGDKCTMNGGNNPGVYVAQQHASSAVTKFLVSSKLQLNAAVAHPVEASKGFLKAIANTPSDIIELLARASINARADELANTSLVLGASGQTDSAKLAKDVANRYRETGNSVELPKFTLQNDAQKGGEKIGILAELLTTGVSSIRAVGKLGTVTVARSARSSSASTAGLRVLGKSGRVATRPNEAFFWSGRTNGVGGQDVAAELAKQRGGTTLEMLIERNKIQMPAWNPDDPTAIKAWEDISAEYAAGASGRVRAVIGESLRPGNIWETKELPRLMNNPNVTEITTIDPVSHIEKPIFKR